MPDFDVAIIGGGPSGLATAIECTRKGLSCIVIEKGSLVDAIRRFPVNMVFFTTPDLLVIGDLPLVCSREKPTRLEALKYYRLVTEHFRLQTRLYERVEEARAVNGHFKLESSYQRGQVGEPEDITAKKIVVATGYYDNPNLIGVPGEDLPKVSHYFTEPHPYYGLKTAVIGGAGVEVILVHRGKELSTHIKYWVRPDILNRIERKEIVAYLETEVEAILPDKIRLKRKGKRFDIANDAVLALTGYQPDYGFLGSMGIRIDRGSGKPEFDPETFETNVSGIYIAGGIVAGRQTNKIFIENGRFHGQKIVKHLTCS